MTPILDPEPALHDDRAMTFLSFAHRHAASDAERPPMTKM